MATTLSYKDINITFKKHPVTDDIVVSKDASAIKQAIVNLLLTNKGERLMNPEYGSDIRRYLFEPLDYGTSALVKQNIVTTIGRFEPRISVQEIVSRPDFENNGFEITMTYSIVGTSNPPVTVDFFLSRTR
jgi:hypothetical protein|tara:strand:- start:266 stop:658 length:393 start_codon:yes stop_codon:yes gene_type:complete